MTDRELFIKALDALEKMKAHSYLRLDYAEEAINALRDRLAQPEQEPVAWELRTDRVLIEITNNPERAHDWKASLNDVVPLYANSRPWVGLTEEEVSALQDLAYADDVEFVRHIESKLKEKNEIRNP